LANNNVLPAEFSLRSSDANDTANVAGSIFVDIPALTVVTGVDGTTPYNGNIYPPQFIKPTANMLSKAGNSAIVFAMGHSGQTIKFSNDLVLTLTLDTDSEATPLIWSSDSNGDFTIAGKDGIKNGIGFVRGGVSLNVNRSGNTYTHTVGLLIDHMSTYVIGVAPVVTNLVPSTINSGQNFTLSGRNFSPGVIVKFGTRSATIVSNLANALTVSSTGLPTGSRSVVVINSDGLMSAAFNLAILNAVGSEINNTEEVVTEEIESQKNDKKDVEEAVATKLKSDINGDGKVDLLDFNGLMVNWGNAKFKNQADFNADNKVDLGDFNIMMIDWSNK